jgi:ribosomal protein S18 acetylase RimI-like enzyme
MLKKKLMKNIADIIALGPRPSGSLAELQAAEFIKKQLENLALDEVKIQSFTTASHLALDADLIALNNNNRQFETSPTLFSPAGNVSGELIFIGSCHCSYVDNVTDLTGKIGLLRPTGSIEERTNFILELERRGLEGLIVISPTFDFINAKIIRYPEVKQLPSVAVSWHTACELKQAIGQQFSLTVNHSDQLRHESVNVIGKINGKSDNWLVLSAHIDTAPHSEGANDNASGVAILLEHAKQLATAEQPDATIYLLFSGSEEYGGFDGCGGGAKAFYQTMRSKLMTCIAHLEFDDLGNMLLPQNIIVGGNKSFLKIFDNLDVNFPYQVIEDYVPGCDHGVAIQHGIPFAFFCNNMMDDPIYHTSSDTIEFIDPNAMVEAFNLTRQIITTCSTCKPFFPYLTVGDITVRPAYYDDLDAIRKITKLAFEPVSLDRMAEKFFNERLGSQDWDEYKNNALTAQCKTNIYKVIVAELAGQVVGYATMIIDEQRGIAEIGNNAVQPNFQGRGIGKTMQQEIMRRMLEAGFDKFKVNTLSNDIAAQNLYKKLGFKEIMTEIYYLKSLKE